MPEVKVRFFPLAIVVSPLSETAPVPVPKVLAPVWEKVLSRVVAPCKVIVPGVVVDPRVLIEEAPVPRVEFPEEVRVVKEPAPPVIAPARVRLPLLSRKLEALKNSTLPVFWKPRSKFLLLVAFIWGVKLPKTNLALKEASPPAPKVPLTVALLFTVKAVFAAVKVVAPLKVLAVVPVWV